MLFCTYTFCEPRRTRTGNKEYSFHQRECLAAARRARQITEIEELTGTGDPKNKPLSQAVRELYNGQTRILNEDEIAEEDAKIEELQRVNRELIKAQQAASGYGKWANPQNYDDEEIDAEAETATEAETTEETTENNDEE